MHHLNAITFSKGNDLLAVYNFSDIGVPQWFSGPVEGRTLNWHFSIGEHGFTLHYGLFARTALSQLVLIPEGLSQSIDSLPLELANLVSSQLDGQLVNGCMAIGAIACTAARLPTDCLDSACPLGLAALATYLDQGFQLAEVNETDFKISGEVELWDLSNDFQVDQIGTPANPGVWKAWIKIGQEAVTAVDATFYGQWINN
jgi:hypothetical protein